MALSSSARNEAANWIRGSRTRDTGAYGDFANRFKGYGEEGYNYGKGIRDYATDKYKGLYGELEGGYGVGGGGGIPGYGGEFDQYKSWFDKLGELGGSSPEQVDALRGWGTFKDFATTGGWTPQQMADFRARSASGTPQLFDTLRQGIVRRGAIQGGYGPGYDAALAQVARDRARAIAETQLGAETNLASSVREGRKWGATGGSAAEQQVLENMIKGQTTGMSIAERIAAANRAAAASRNASLQESLAGRLRILDEMRGLRGETGTEIPYGEMELRGLGGRTAADRGYLSDWNETQQKGPSFWDKLLGSATGVGSAFFGGGYARGKG